MKNSLLLGRGGRVLNVIPWTKAVTLMYFRAGGNAVFPLEYHDIEVHSKSRSFRLPSVLLLTGKRDRYKEHDRLPLTRHNVFLRDEFTCQWCGKKLSSTSGTIDHVYPTSKGGTNTWRNVVACCVACNNEKGDMMAEKFTKLTGKKLARKPVTPQRGMLFKSYLNQDGYAAWEPYLGKAIA